MTPSQYWDEDPILPKHYRKAEKIRRERKNEEAWLQAMYIYDVIGRLSPALQAFPPKGAKTKPYLSEPYPLSRKSQELQQQRHDELVSSKGLARMKSFMQQFNQFNEERK